MRYRLKEYQIINPYLRQITLSHGGRVTHICVSEIIIIGSDNGLSPCRRQAIIWTNAGILLIGSLGINFSEILIEINRVSFNEIHLKMSSAKRRLFRLGLNVLSELIEACYICDADMVGHWFKKCFIACTMLSNVNYRWYQIKKKIFQTIGINYADVYMLH